MRSSRCSPSVDFADRSKDHAMTALYRATTRPPALPAHTPRPWTQLRKGDNPASRTFAHHSQYRHPRRRRSAISSSDHWAYRLRRTAPIDQPTASKKPPLDDYDSGADWQAPDGVEIPILSTLRPRVLGSGCSWVATGLRLPWTDSGAGAESACLAADMCVGPPVATACAGRWIPHPNPDLSLRFVGQVAGPELVGIGRLDRISAGLAAVNISVWSGNELVAVGVCSSMLLAAGR
ncbi:hypothetical protein I552_7108 [Mycobacterium xenopi 3993]|nr:hypothetical protein I552_7108 [Mycobacterium xenopi 3993]